MTTKPAVNFSDPSSWTETPEMKKYMKKTAKAFAQKELEGPVIGRDSFPMDRLQDAAEANCPYERYTNGFNAVCLGALRIICSAYLKKT